MSLIPEDLKAAAANFTLQLHTVSSCGACKMTALPQNLERIRKQIAPINFDTPIQHQGWTQINLTRQFPQPLKNILFAPVFVLLPTEDANRNGIWDRAYIFKGRYKDGTIFDKAEDPNWEKNETFGDWLIRSLRELSEKTNNMSYIEEFDFIPAPVPENKNEQRKVHRNFILVDHGQSSSW